MVFIRSKLDSLEIFALDLVKKTVEFNQVSTEQKNASIIFSNCHTPLRVSHVYDG
jgi:hypothetical protein